MNGDRESIRENAQRDIMRHLTTLHERCEELLAARDPFSVHNSMHGLKSLLGQLDTASQRYRRMS